MSSPSLERAAVDSESEPESLVRRDKMDAILGQWATVRPDVDVAPMAITGRILRLARHLDRHIGRTLRTVGLSGGEFDALGSLRRAEGGGNDCGLLPTELQDALLITSGTVTHRIQRLERRGLVTRVACDSDRRCTYVRLTDEGRRVIDDALDTHAAGLHRLLRHIPPEDREQLADLLRDLCAELS